MLYRTNAQSRAIEDVFRQFGLAYQVVGGVSFYQRREVKDTLAYLRIVRNPLDSVALARVINTPPRGIGDKTRARLMAFARANELTPTEALLRAEEIAGHPEAAADRAHRVRPARRKAPRGGDDARAARICSTASSRRPATAPI